MRPSAALLTPPDCHRSGRMNSATPGATLAAATGATTKELMRRLGHSSPAAALLYQHAADDRDADIARALDAMLGALSQNQDGSEPPD